MDHESILNKLVPQFVEGGELTTYETLHGGLINATYLVDTCVGEKLVMQRVNTAVFTKPELVMNNIQRVTAHLKEVSPTSRNLHLISTVDAASFILDGEGGLWRAFNYLADCVGYEYVYHADLAYEAGLAFGQFLTQLSTMETDNLAETIPDFHHTPSRLVAFDQALAEDRAQRAAGVLEECTFIDSCRSWVSILEDLRVKGELPTRTTHNDTKISNVLFDKETQKAVCVIDLDTVMPGTVLYDFGDLVRTSVNGVSEDAPVDKVECRLDVFDALAKGYLEAAGATLTAVERKYLVFSAKLITLELSLRFLTDYLKGDTYFSVSYEAQNLDRAKNQLRLLELLGENETEMEEIVAKYLP